MTLRPATSRRLRRSTCRARSSRSRPRDSKSCASTSQNTNVVSPVDGFVGKRNLDVGACVVTESPVASVVDISSLRLVANVVEKDLRAVTVGDSAQVEVDAYPGEKFTGRIARLAPVLDPATRTAHDGSRIPESHNRLKPGMYARVDLTVEDKSNALVIPKIALVDSQGQRGVYQPGADNRAKFKPVRVGHRKQRRCRDSRGPERGRQVVSNGAGALRRDDQLVDRRRGDGNARRRRGGPGDGCRRGRARRRAQSGANPTETEWAKTGQRRAGQPRADSRRRRPSSDAAAQREQQRR